MKKICLSIFVAGLFTGTITAQTSQELPYWVQADKLCTQLMTMDTHNHVDVPMTSDKIPGPHVDLRTAMQKAGMSAIGMTFAVDYVQPLAPGQSYERFRNAMIAQDSILQWSKLSRTLNLKQMRTQFKRGEPIVIQCVEGGHFLEGGVIGVWPHLAASPEEYAANIKAMVDIIGIDHVCIGTDSKITPEYSEITPEMIARFQREHKNDNAGGKQEGRPQGPPKKDPNAVNHEWNDQPDNFYHSVVRALLAEGFSKKEIQKIVSENWVFGMATKNKRI